MREFSITVHNELPIPRDQEPVTVGVPFARGALRDAAQLRIAADTGHPAPSQARAQVAWDDGSVRWALVHFLGDLKADGPTRFRVTQGGAKCGDAPAIKLSRELTRVRVDVGRLQFSVDGATFRGLEYVRIPARDGKSWVAAAGNAQGGSLYLIDREGKTYTAQNGAVKVFEVEEEGPLVCTIRVEGEMAAESGRGGIVEYDLWIRAFAGSSTVRMFLTIRNPRATVRRVLGHWPLGLEGSVYFKEAGWQVGAVQDGVPFVTVHGGELSYLAPEQHPEINGLTAVPAPQLNAGGASETYRGPFTREAKLVQDSSGGDNWFHRNHINRDWTMTVNYRGWKAFVDGTEVRQGDRAEAWVAVEDPRVGCAIGMRHFWQNFPKAVRAVKDADGRPLVQLALWPREPADARDDVHELQGGEQKTHELVLHFFRGDQPRPGGPPIPYASWPEVAIEMRRAMKPAAAMADFEQYAAGGAFDFIAPHDAKREPHYEAVNEGSLLSQPANLRTQIEAFDEYGWRNFGDFVADGEIDGRILSHYNLEYDMGYAMLMQAIRTQNGRPDLSRLWWDMAEAALRHEADIDVYHTSLDAHSKGGYNHGKHHHTEHAYEVGRSTHRAYEEEGMQGDLSVYSIRGGGPESGHMNTRGMLTYAWMAGYPAPMKVAKNMADLVVSKVEHKGFSQIGGYGRESAHNIQILLEAYHLTNDRSYLEVARHIIDVSHPDRQPWANGFPVKNDRGEIDTGAPGMLLWQGSILLKETASYLHALESEGKTDDRARSFILMGAELHNRWGWDENRGRFAHSVNSDGTQYLYREPWWDLKVLEMVAWACRWQEDASKRKLWLSRAARNFEVATKLLAPDPAKPPFYQSKCSTVAAQNGPGYMALREVRNVAAGSNR